MRKLSAATLVALLTSSMIFIPLTPAKAEENCATVDLLGGPVCLTVVDGEARVTGLGGVELTAPVPVQEVPVYVNVPGPTITNEVPVPVPGPTVSVPGPTKTVTVPGPTETITVPGPTTTVTETQTATATPTPGAGQESSSPATITVTTPNDSKPTTRTRFIQVTVPQAVTFSLLALLLGAFVVLLVMYGMYRLGRKEGEHSLDGFLEELRDLMMIRKR